MRTVSHVSTSPLSSRANAGDLRQISPFRSKQGFLVVLEMTRQVTDTQSPLFCHMLRWQRTEGSGAESCVTPYPDPLPQGERVYSFVGSCSFGQISFGSGVYVGY